MYEKTHRKKNLWQKLIEIKKSKILISKSTSKLFRKSKFSSKFFQWFLFSTKKNSTNCYKTFFLCLFFYKNFFYELLPNFSFFSYQITKKNYQIFSTKIFLKYYKKKYQIFSTIIILGRHPKTKINITGHRFFFLQIFFLQIVTKFFVFFYQITKKKFQIFSTKIFLPNYIKNLPNFFYQF